jgi:hypothetical protein
MNAHFPSIEAEAPSVHGPKVYRRVADLQLAARALDRYCTMYRDTPAHPANQEYRDTRLAWINQAASDMLEALRNE